MSEIKFRTYDQEREQIRERNKARTDYILEAAGITKENPDYNRWYRATMINVHNAYRFSYNGETEADLEKVFESFVEAIQENPIEKYEEATKEFLYQRATQQLDKAVGGYADASTYDEMRKKLDETIKSGMEIREQEGTTFPKEFYTEGGGLQRLVYDIPLSEQEESSMLNIDMMVAKYKDKGVEFDTSKNRFIVKEREVGPQKFFSSRQEKLEKFLAKKEQNPESFDKTDKELLDVIKSGDFERFTEIRKQRGMNRDKTNEDLRTALSDEIIFHEVSEKWNSKENQDVEALLESVWEISESFKKSAEIVSKESEKDVLGRIDTIYFSVIPEDVAEQSTFKNWKSCMHTTGCNHSYVDDSIGMGSIVAYGYDSKDPSKMVARLLIHPYEDEVTGEVLYRVNDRIYGRDNLGFRKAVTKVIEHFNEEKSGTYRLKEGLYNDNGAGRRAFSIVEEKDNVFDLTNFRRDSDNVITLAEFDFSKAKEIIVPEGAKLKFEDCILSGDLSSLKGATFESCTFKDAILPEEAKLELKVSFENTRCPESVEIGGYFHGVEYVGKMPEIKGTKFEDLPTTLKNVQIPEGSDLSDMKDLKLTGDIKIGEGVKLPDGIRFEQARITQNLEAYSDINMVFADCVFSEGSQLPKSDKVVLKYNVVITDPSILTHINKYDISDESMFMVEEGIPVTQELLDNSRVTMIVDKEMPEILLDRELQQDDIRHIIQAIAKDEDTKQELLGEVSSLKVVTKEEFIAKGGLQRKQSENQEASTEHSQTLKERIVSSVKDVCDKAIEAIPQGIKDKIVKPKQSGKTHEEKKKDKKVVKTIQTKRGVMGAKKAKKATEVARTLTNEEIATIQATQQREGGR